MTNIEEIWNKFLNTKDSYYRNKLMDHYRYLVKDVAERLLSKLPDKIELDDLISAGLSGLMDSIEAFEPAQGLKFEAYCKLVIRVSILRELKSMDRIPHSVRARTHQLGKTTHNLEFNDSEDNKLKDD